jgi:hypothetical protein
VKADRRNRERLSTSSAHLRDNAAITAVIEVDLAVEQADQQPAKG